MRRIFIVERVAQEAVEAERIGHRAAVLAEELADSAPRLDIARRRLAAGEALGALATQEIDALWAVGWDAAALAELAVLKAPLIWDLSDLDPQAVAALGEDEAGRGALSAALAAARGFTGVSEALALAVEDLLKVGLSSHSPQAVLAAVTRPVAVAMGTGLGNMIYAVPMLRWLSERLRKPIDLVIHDRFDEGVTLFARAPWIHAIYPGYEYLCGRSYDLFVASVTAGSLPPAITARKTLHVNAERDYNEEGRFIHETRLNFLGLETLFDHDPALAPELPRPFIRDINYHPPGQRIVGIANGKKSALWAKREWDGMQALTERLVAEGWEVRSFGLPAEYVPGAQDFTGIPLRDMLHEIARCAFFISYDGGIAHMAEGMGVPTIWLFGSTGTVKNGPVHQHSRVILSQRPCGPCLYKDDWVRCTRPLCMEDLKLEEVVKTLYELEAEIARDGWTDAPAQPDPRLVGYEIDALVRPGPAHLRTRALAARLGPLPRNPLALNAVVLKLLAVGDVTGAAHLAEACAAAGRGGPVNDLLRAVIATVHPVGLTPSAGLVPAASLPAPGQAQGLLVEMMGLFSSEQRSLLLNLITRLFAPDAHRAQGALFLATAAASVFFSRDIQRPLLRTQHRFIHRGQPPGTDGSPTAALEDSPSLRRMSQVRATPVADRLQAAAAALAAPLGLAPEKVWESGFAPFASTLDHGLAPPVRLQIGRWTREVPHRSVVLVIVPHVMTKGALPGSTSALLLMHLTRLAMIGLRPVVVTTGFDDVPDGWTLRDSVTYLQGHRLWPAREWETLAAVWRPAAVLCYGGIEQDLDLPPAMAADLLPLTLTGLYDLHGCFVEFAPTERWAAACDGPEPGPGAVPADALTAALVVPPPRPTPLPRPLGTPVTALVLLPDASDMTALMRLITVMPSVRFTVMTALQPRGIEKNVVTVPPGMLKAEDWSADLLIQFSTRPVTLAAETLVWAERGGRALACPKGSALGFGALLPGLVVPADPSSLADWERAVRRTVRAADAGDLLREIANRSGLAA